MIREDIIQRQNIINARLYDGRGDSKILKEWPVDFDVLKDYEKREFSGVIISADILKDKMGFIERTFRVGLNTTTTLVRSIESSGKFYIIVIKGFGEKSELNIELDGSVICTASVSYIHQIQNIVSSITGEIIDIL